MFSHKAVRAQLPLLRGEAEAISLLRTELPQICFRASFRNEETNGPKETRQKDKTGPRRT